MKKMYQTPELVEFGPVGTLTLGSGGNLPDYDQVGNLINNICNTETFTDPVSGGTFTRVSCGNGTVIT